MFCRVFWSKTAEEILPPQKISRFFLENPFSEFFLNFHILLYFSQKSVKWAEILTVVVKKCIFSQKCRTKFSPLKISPFFCGKTAPPSFSKKKKKIHKMIQMGWNFDISCQKMHFFQKRQNILPPPKISLFFLENPFFRRQILKKKILTAKSIFKIFFIENPLESMGDHF